MGLPPTDNLTAPWAPSHRFDKAALPLADAHYNRRKPGSPQFCPPGRCVVFLTPCRRALWVTSWPYGEYVRHAWPGAWVNSLFRTEGAGRSSELIRAAVSATAGKWDMPDEGIVSFVDPSHVPGVMVRGVRIYGFCYLKAGWTHVGFTKGGLWVWRLLPPVKTGANYANPMQAAE